LFARLRALQPHTNDYDEQRPVLLGLDADAQRIFADFYNECSRRAFEPDPRTAAQWAKLSGYAARLALVGQLAHDPGAKQITGDIMRAACELARWFGNEAERIFASLGETPAQRDRRTLLEFIERRGGEVTVRDVITYYWRLKNQREKAEFELNMLVKAGAGKWEEAHPDGRGRPTRVFQILRASASAQLTLCEAETPNSADMSVGTGVGTELNSKSAQFTDSREDSPNSADADATSISEKQDSENSSDVVI